MPPTNSRVKAEPIIAQGNPFSSSNRMTMQISKSGNAFENPYTSPVDRKSMARPVAPQEEQSIF